jgi:hypothetical protein
MITKSATNVQSAAKILTFAETDDDNTKEKIITDKSGVTWTVPAHGMSANAHGLMFRWGSLVGLWGRTPSSFTTSDVRFFPANYAGSADLSNTGSTAVSGTDLWAIIPYAANNVPVYQSLDQDAFMTMFPGVGYDARTGRGDICRYISDMGWVTESYRMPTAMEWKMLGDETLKAPNGAKINILAENASSQDLSGESNFTGNSSTGYKHAFTPFIHARVLGAGALLSDNITDEDVSKTDSRLTTPTGDRVLLPVGGHRGDTSNQNGNLNYVGRYAYYASSTPSTTVGQIFYTWFHVSVLTTVRTSGNSYAMSVRCIRNYNDE